jgi:hypothetical protein
MGEYEHGPLLMLYRDAIGEIDGLFITEPPDIFMALEQYEDTLKIKEELNENKVSRGNYPRILFIHSPINTKLLHIYGKAVSSFAIIFSFALRRA